MLLFLLVIFHVSNSSAKLDPEEIERTAAKVFDFIISVSNNGHFDKEHTGIDIYDLYSGSGGVILSSLEMFRLNKEEKFLNFSMTLAEDIMKNKMEIYSYFDVSFFHKGLSGLAFIFHELSRFTNSTKFYDFAKELDDKIIEEFAKEQQKMATLRHGASGTGLYLIHLLKNNIYSDNKQMNNDIYESLIKGTEFIIEMGEKIDNDKLKWYYEGTSGPEAPNYAGGTAGVSHFFSALYEYTKEKKYLNIAIKGANYLHSIADTSEDGFIVYHTNMPQDDAKYYLGECNGPSGTGKFFINLYQKTGDSTFLNFAKKSANSIFKYLKTFNWWVAKDESKSFYWDNMSVCGGNAAVIEFLSLLNYIHPQEKYSNAINELVDNIMSRKVEKKEDSLVYWNQAEWRTSPDQKNAEVGIYQGAAGIAKTMLFLIHPEIRIKLPDYVYEI